MATLAYRFAALLLSLLSISTIILYGGFIFVQPRCRTDNGNDNDGDSSDEKASQIAKKPRWHDLDEPHHPLEDQTGDHQQPTPSAIDSRLHFILHLGPRKTRTTTLQCTFVHFDSFLRTNTSYTFIGTDRDCDTHLEPTGFVSGYISSEHEWLDCLKDSHPDHTVEKVESCEAWVEFKRELKALANERRNVIFSSVAILLLTKFERGMELFRSALSKDFNVQVVFVYRHYFDLLVSEWNQRTKIKQRNVKDWRGKAHPDLVQFIREKRWNHPPYLGLAVASDLHPVSYLKAKWERFYDDIVILDMHLGESIFAQFLLRTSRELYESRMAQLGFDLKVFNPSENVYADKLAVAAYEKGMVKGQNRRKIGKAVANAFNDSFWKADDLPRICLSDIELDTLLNQSFMFEATVFPRHFGNAYYRSTHKRLFDAAVAQYKFCDPDNEALLTESEDVRDFFSQNISR